MPRAKDVMPEKWTKIRVLYDDGVYSAIWGNYEEVEGCLGTRWNGNEDDVGYPNMGGNPLWYVEADFLILPILHEIRSILLYDKCREIDDRDKCLEGTLFAIQEYCRLKGKKKSA